MNAQPAQSLPARIGACTVLKLAWPVLISRLSLTAMATADIFFVAPLGTTSLAAVGLGVVASFTGIAFAQGALGAVRVATAHRVGAGDPEGADRVAVQGLLAAIVLGLMVAPLGQLAPQLFQLMGADPEVAVLAARFTGIRLLAAPWDFATLAMTGWHQGRGDTRTPMIATLIANGLNIALDPLFIYGPGPFPELGMAGAALATDLASLAGALWLASRSLPLLLRFGRPARAMLHELSRLGAPMGTQFFLEVGAHAVFMAVLARVGAEQMAAHVIAARVISVSFLPGYALGEAAGVLVGQSLGAGRQHSAREAHRAALTLGIGVMAAWGVVFLFWPSPLVGIFSPAAEVAPVAMNLLKIAALFQVLDAVAMIGLLALQGAGDARFTMATALSAAWLVKLPVGIALALRFGAAGAWFGFLAEITVVAALVIWRIRGDRWLQRAAVA